MKGGIVPKLHHMARPMSSNGATIVPREEAPRPRQRRLSSIAQVPSRVSARGRVHAGHLAPIRQKDSPDA